MGEKYVQMLDPFLELLTIRKPTEIQRIIDLVPRPPRSEPPRPGFPQWDMSPLNLNLSLPPGMPKEVTIYHRDRLGEKLWKGYGCAEYYLKDPNANQIKFFPYEALHDPNLKTYYDRPANSNLMIKNGFISHDGKVYCTLAQFNSFRRYLYTTQLFHVQNAIRWHDAMERERLELRRFNDYMQRDIHKDERHEYFRQVSTKMREERLAAEEKHRNKLEKQRAAGLRRSATAEKRRMTRLLATKERAIATALRVQRQLQEAQCARRRLALRTLRRAHDGAIERCFLRRLRLEEQNDTKEKRAWARYKCKVQSQMERYQLEAQLLEWNREVIKDNIVERNRALDIEQRRIGDLLENIQTKHVKVIKAKKDLKIKDKYLLAVTKAWDIPKEVKPWMIEQAVLTALAKNKSPTGGHEVLATLQDIKEQLTVSSQMPEAVAYVLGVLLENVIKEYIRKNLFQILQEVQDKVTEKMSATASAMRERRRSNSQRRSSVSSWGRGGGDRRGSVVSGGRGEGRRRSLLPLLSPPSFPSTSEGDSSAAIEATSSPSTADSSALSTAATAAPSPTRRRSSGSKLERRRSSNIPSTKGISFGEVTTIGKFITEKELLPTKDRPPTPVPSLEDLAVAVAEDPLELKSEDVSNKEQQKLKNLLRTIFEVLYNNVLRYFETRSPVTKTLFSGLTGTELRLNDVVRRMTEKIIESDDAIIQDSDELHMAEKYLIQELQGRLPFIKVASRENLAGVRRPSI